MLATLTAVSCQRIKIGKSTIMSSGNEMVLASSDGATLTLSSNSDGPRWVSSHMSEGMHVLVLSGVPLGCVGSSYDSICAPAPSMDYFPPTFSCAWLKEGGIEKIHIPGLVRPSITEMRVGMTDLGLQASISCPAPSTEELTSTFPLLEDSYDVNMTLQLVHKYTDTQIPYVGRPGQDAFTFTVPALTSPPPPSPAGFKSSQVIDGKTVNCGSTSTSVTKTTCMSMTIDGLKGFRNGVSCGPEWRSSNPQGSDLIGFCNRLTGTLNGGSFYYQCEGSTTRATWNGGMWGTANDNGYVDGIECLW